MWPAKLPGEGDAIYTACKAMRDIMIELGPAIDGGKDSLSMAAKTDDGETVKTPGTLVVSLYCTMEDITKKVTPDFKKPGHSSIIFVDLGSGKNRMGGSALAQVYGQVGSSCPDLEEPETFRRAWDLVQHLIHEGLVLAGHDRSDGGLIVTLLEMAFAGNCGIDIVLPSGITSVDSGAAGQPQFVRNVLFPLFSEEVRSSFSIIEALLSMVTVLTLDAVCADR
jgi:phosphoribosylformylglycinamidine synthase